MKRHYKLLENITKEDNTSEQLIIRDVWIMDNVYRPVTSYTTWIG
jgi:hypothetical protein